MNENETTANPIQSALEFIDNNTREDIAKEMAAYSKAIDEKDKSIELMHTYRRNLSNTHEQLLTKVTEFLREHISNNASASVNDLRELADELEIEMTKMLTVTFTVEVTYEFEAPIDFTEDDIDDSDFRVDIEYHGSENAEPYESAWSIEQFNVEVNN